MRELKIISFTEQGSCLNAELNQKLLKQGYDCKGYAVERFAEAYGLLPLDKNLKEWIGTHWGKCSFVFIGAVGIAVRSIAPWIGDKFTDSAVLSIDEKGQFVIPVLSGHVGGAVELSRILAECLDAVLAITTATDVQGKFAVDVFAEKNGLYITDREIAKAISAAVLEGKTIGFFSTLPVNGGLPEHIKLCGSRQSLETCSYGIFVGERSPRGRKRILELIPKNIVIGIGCRKDIPYELLERGINTVLAENQIEREQVAAFASIDLKKDEKSLRKLSELWKVPFFTYPAEKLEIVGKVSSSSEFVRQVTGVDNVCERAALCHCENHGKKGCGWSMVQPKICLESMTAAVVKQEMEIQF